VEGNQWMEKLHKKFITEIF